MLACGHERESSGTPICTHLRGRPGPRLSCQRWYSGVGMASELLCKSCTEDRESGLPVATEEVCDECLEHAADEIGNVDGIRGRPEIRMRLEPFDPRLQSVPLPSDLGKLIDIAPVMRAGRSCWLLLSEDGVVARFDADSGDWTELARASPIPEADHEPWNGRVLRPRLHASSNGDFAAIVNDYGRHGQIVDLRSGRVSLQLDGGDYHQDTVPFSFAFAEFDGRTVAIHRTAWNRLDISDPSTGALLTDRGPTSYNHGEDRPDHYLDYFHGAIRISPNGVRIVDDGWVWHPAGIPTTWMLETWLRDNPWESEDGPTLSSICQRFYDWDRPLAWIDDDRIAIGGLGDDDREMIDGARIFDLSSKELGPLSPPAAWSPPREVASFAGPAGSFSSDGRYLFSSDGSGLSRWSLTDGCCTGHLPGFQPRYHHRGARELVQLVDHSLIRWAIDSGEPS